MPGRRECPAWTRRCGGRSRRRGGARSCHLHPSMLVALVSLCGTVAWIVRRAAVVPPRSRGRVGVGAAPNSSTQAVARLRLSSATPRRVVADPPPPPGGRGSGLVLVHHDAADVPAVEHVLVA